MKKRIAVFVVLAVLLSSIPVFGADQVTVLVNGAKVESDVPAVIVEGRTMLPFRSIFNALGVSDSSIVWDQGSKSIQVNHEGQYLFMIIGNPGVVIDETLVTLDVAPFIQNGRALVPIRFVSEALKARVSWNQQSKTVTIIK